MEKLGQVDAQLRRLLPTQVRQRVRGRYVFQGRRVCERPRTFVGLPVANEDEVVDATGPRFVVEVVPVRFPLLAIGRVRWTT